MRKVLLAAPHFDEQRGNKITVERIQECLVEKGYDITILSSTSTNVDSYPKDVDIIHGFHATKFRAFLKRHKNSELTPFILSMTGTDINQDFYDDVLKVEMLNLCEKALAIHVFESAAKEKLVQERPHLDKKIFVIPQSIRPFKSVKSPFSKPSNKLIVLPAGIRPVKNVLQAVNALKLVAKEQNVCLWLVGPILDQSEGERVLEAIKDEPWVHYKGSVSYHEMGAILKDADLVLNTSLHEGQSSAVLEAMMSRTPVIVSANDGNKSIVKDKETGLIYQSEQDLRESVVQLLNDTKTYELLAENALKYVKNVHDPDQECKMLSDMYAFARNS
ncbi:glycosyltransferase family 4 protein [Paenalkalicoccus suaedae]|uniref:Glycosyltransferase family 4 protein n=1 Tax=Paenalkalicoccus suaedae TaxID=2592382 RepID=A0A859FDX3_9BACI|nr:glycosyltransferase [Paenalkalicoccus suaedae]QKS71287.1 glycosyltransferase family 4 protein [Paenalkalicoccus suaedae]